MECWDILNENGLTTGKTVVRGNIRLNPGEYHLVVHIWVLGSDGRLLIQRRANDKELMPGEWAATGGAAISGETSVQAAIRELSEELGIAVNENGISLIRRITRKNSFVDLWLVRTDADTKSLKLQRSEVAEVKWVWPMELLDMVKSGNFHNYGKDYFDIILSGVNRSTKSKK